MRIRLKPRSPVSFMIVRRNEKSLVARDRATRLSCLGATVSRRLLVVAEAHHDIVKLFVGDEAAAMQQLVLVDRFGQLLSIRVQQAV